MATARDLLHSKKSAGVITTMPDCTILDACRLMRDRRIGSLVVSEDGKLRGIITERDVVNRVVAEGLDPAGATVENAMTERVIAVRPDRSVEEIEAAGSQASRRAAAELAAKARRGAERNLSYQGAHDPTAGGDFIVDTVKGGGPKVGRNDPCPCGSGKKYKKCHGDKHGE